MIASAGWIYTASTGYGLPLCSATAYSSSTSGTTYTPVSGQSQSRPIILHRPYRSVAELGYVYSNTPWKNIDFFTPESGYSALLDTFCINEDTNPTAEIAGRVDLNTRQVPVLQAILSGAYRDAEAPSTSSLSATEAALIAQALINANHRRTGHRAQCQCPSAALQYRRSGGPMDKRNHARLDLSNRGSAGRFHCLRRVYQGPGDLSGFAVNDH
jgi:hypothetical protein